MMYRTLALTALVLITPLIGNAQAPTMEVLLSEIAWMGTDESADNEWIEIYNFSTAPRDITGWALVACDNTNPSLFTVSLKGTLAPHGTGVLERTNDTTLPGVNAFQIYTGGLKNDGEGLTITLFDANDSVSDKAVGGTDWAGIGGRNTAPKMTAQRTRTGTWVTALPTPGADNTQENAEGVEATTTNAIASTCVKAIQSSTSNEVSNRTGGGGGGSAKRSSSSAPKENIPPKLALSIDGPKTAYVNQEVSFTAVSSGIGPTIEKMLSYDWNFGDTYTGKGKEEHHVFEYPGEYVVVVEGAVAKQYAMARQEVKVLPVSFTLSKNAKGDIEVKNNANYETDLGGFSLRGGATPFTFPKYTFVKGGGTLVVPAKRFGNTSSLSLHDSQGVSVFALGGGTAPRPLATRPSNQQVVTEAPASEEPVASAESTVIRIGNASEVPERGFLGSFFARIARIFGS